MRSPWIGLLDPLMVAPLMVSFFLCPIVFAPSESKRASPLLTWSSHPDGPIFSHCTVDAPRLVPSLQMPALCPMDANVPSLRVVTTLSPEVRASGLQIRTR